MRLAVLVLAPVNSIHGAVVIGGYANGLTTVRALAPLRIPIAVVATRPTDIAQYSKWATERLTLTGFHSDPESLVELLESRGWAWRKRIIFPTNDHSLRVLSTHRDRLSENYVIPVPPWQNTRILLDKFETVRLASRVGISTPKSFGRTIEFQNKDPVLDFPVVIKPRHGHLFYERFRKKLFFVRSRDELDRRVGQLEAASLEGIVQEWIPGGDDCFFNYSVYIDRFGNPLGGFSMHKLRKSPPHFGVCRVSETWVNDELREPTLEFLRAAGWRGMANAEFKRDPRDGSYKLMEINGRCFLMQGLPLRAGINYPNMAVTDFGYGAKPSIQANGWRGVWIHLHAELLYGLLSRHSEQVRFRNFLRPYFKRKTFAVWNCRDPKPFLAQWFKTAKLALGSPEARKSLFGSIETVPLTDTSPNSRTWVSASG
jgi:predicted ATP-grasp superfamily ATP-dependent carboligase